MTFEVDISVLGMPELERALKRIDAKAQRTIVRRALRKSAKRTQKRVVENLSGLKVQVRSGDLRKAFTDAKIRGASRRGMIRLGIEFPTRDKLGIAADDPYYYPTAVEYGHGDVDPYPYLRPAIDEHKASEIRLVGKDIGDGIEKEAGKK